MTDNILSLLGLAHKAGKVEIGEEPTGSAARAKKSRVIFLAADAAPATKRRAQSFADTGSCLLLPLGAEKDSIGRVLGRTSCAMCAVTDIGFAEAIVKKLAAIEPTTYQAAADALALKAKRAAERRREQIQHEKNQKSGKKRIHTADAVTQKNEARERSPQKTLDAEKTPRKSGGQRERPSGRPAAKRKRTETPNARFIGSLPVKKGKGSRIGTTSKKRTKVPDQH